VVAFVEPSLRALSVAARAKGCEMYGMSTWGLRGVDGVTGV